MPERVGKARARAPSQSLISPSEASWRYKIDGTSKLCPVRRKKLVGNQSIPEKPSRACARCFFVVHIRLLSSGMAGPRLRSCVGLSRHTTTYRSCGVNYVIVQERRGIGPWADPAPMVGNRKIPKGRPRQTASRRDLLSSHMLGEPSGRVSSWAERFSALRISWTDDRFPRKNQMPHRQATICRGVLAATPGGQIQIPDRRRSGLRSDA